jgi:hypothetical protein
MAKKDVFQFVGEICVRSQTVPQADNFLAAIRVVLAAMSQASSVRGFLVRTRLFLPV